LRNPNRYRSVSAFAPISAPSQVPWGHKAFSGYLGADRLAWLEYDATTLVERSPFPGKILVDQGTADQFLAEQLRPELLAEACRRAGQQLRLRMQPGYDHGYWFVQSFMADHVAWHAAALGV
jgi:S-formylglutathione hydrolase